MRVNWNLRASYNPNCSDSQFYETWSSVKVCLGISALSILAIYLNPPLPTTWKSYFTHDIFHSILEFSILKDYWISTLKILELLNCPYIHMRTAVPHIIYIHMLRADTHIIYIHMQTAIPHITYIHMRTAVPHIIYIHMRTSDPHIIHLNGCTVPRNPHLNSCSNFATCDQLFCINHMWPAVLHKPHVTSYYAYTHVTNCKGGGGRGKGAGHDRRGPPGWHISHVIIYYRYLAHVTNTQLLGIYQMWPAVMQQHMTSY